jgi:hypothetical protein
MKNNVNRILSNEELINEIEKQIENVEDCIDILIHVLVFEENGLMDVHLHFDGEYLDADILAVENDMIALQKEIKEIGTLMVEKYNIIPRVEFDLFDGLKMEYVF